MINEEKAKGTLATTMAAKTLSGPDSGKKPKFGASRLSQQVSREPQLHEVRKNLVKVSMNIESHKKRMVVSRERNEKIAS